MDPTLFPPIAEPATFAGTWREVPVYLVAGHDAAAAVVALPGRRAAGVAFVSSGTWILVAAERPHPDTSEAARLANFSNERGAFGGVRFLKNVMGLWVLERCRAAWANPPLDDLLAAAAALPAGGNGVRRRRARIVPRRTVPEIHVVAGGSRNALVNRLIEDACGIPVRVGAALGNALVQGVALGRFESLDEARAVLAATERA